VACPTYCYRRCSHLNINHYLNMYFFKNLDEAIDYYRRGVEKAKRKT